MLFQRESGDCFVGQNSAAMGPETGTKHRELNMQNSTHSQVVMIIKGEGYRSAS